MPVILLSVSKTKPKMKDKILNALKQEYARLGVGDIILMGLAEMLTGTSRHDSVGRHGAVSRVWWVNAKLFYWTPFFF